MKYIYIWEESNIDHIALHDVSLGEAEYVAHRAKAPFPRTADSGKKIVRGQTAQGRYLQVVYVVLEEERIPVDQLSYDAQADLADGAEARYIVHARDLTEQEKRQLRRR